MSEHINPSSRGVSYTANGNTKEFTCPFIVWAKDGVDVYLDGIKQLSTEYEIEGVGNANGCEITFKEAPADGAIVTFIGNTSRERAVDYNQYVTLTAKSMNLDADYQETQIQENTAALKRTILTPVEDGFREESLILPGLEERKNAYLAFDEEGNPMAMGDSQNVVAGLQGTGSTPDAVMVWDGNSGLQAADSGRVFGMPDGAATLGSDGKVPDDQLPERGHKITNAGNPVGYRKTMDFSNEFKVFTGGDAVKVTTNLHTANVGEGVGVLQPYGGEGEIKGSRIKAGVGIGVRELLDHSVEITGSQSYSRAYKMQFTANDWNDQGRIVVTPDMHGLGVCDNYLVSVKDTDGFIVCCTVHVSSDGVITFVTDTPFSGKLMICGEVICNEALLSNPMIDDGDLIVGGELGKPERLPLGELDQVLTVGEYGALQYKTLGDVAWKNGNQPYGVPLLDADGTIPPEYLPFSTMTYKGTFGSLYSTTGGDLPTEGIHSGDMYVCDSAFGSTVVTAVFQVGDQAIYNGEKWERLPSSGMVNPMINPGEMIIGGIGGVPERLPSPKGKGTYILNYNIDDEGRPSAYWSTHGAHRLVSEWRHNENCGFYRVYNDGWTEQGGECTVKDGVDSKVAIPVFRPFYVPFDDPKRYILIFQSITSGNVCAINITEKQRTGFKVLPWWYGGGSSYRSFHEAVNWYACGYIGEQATDEETAKGEQKATVPPPDGQSSCQKCAPGDSWCNQGMYGKVCDERRPWDCY